MEPPTAKVLSDKERIPTDPAHSAGFDHMELWSSDDNTESKITMYPDLGADYKPLVRYFEREARNPPGKHVALDPYSYVLSIEAKMTLYELTCQVRMPANAYARATADYLKFLLHDPINWEVWCQDADRHLVRIGSRGPCMHAISRPLIERFIRADFDDAFPEYRLDFYYSGHRLTHIIISKKRPCKCLIS